MHLNERQKKIKSILIEKGRMTTTELSKLLNVSEQTIRKDLNLLEKENVIKRVHGGAEVITTFMDRLDLYSENKDMLCKVAAQYIKDGDYIFVDGGTTYYYLIDYIPSDISVTIVTSSIPIAEKIKKTSEQEVYILGGVVQSTTLETYSPNMINEVSNMIFDKAYFGVTGFSKDFGLTEDNVYSLELKQHILKNTKQSIMIGVKEKEGIVSFRRVFEFNDIDTFITNKEISEEMKHILKENLELILV